MMNQKRRNNIIELCVFWLLLIFLGTRCYDAVRYKDTGSGGGMDNFYATKVPVDVIAYGSSHAGCTIDNRILWEEYGIASYTLSAGGQSIDGTYFFMLESFRNNKPKVALVDTYTFSGGAAGLDSIYRTSLTGKWSLPYVKYVFEQNDIHHFDRETLEEILLRVPVVHDRYREIEKRDFYNDTWYYRGYRGSRDRGEAPEPVITDERKPLPETGALYLQKMIDLCKKEGVELVLFHAPYSATAEEIAYQNTIREITEEQGFTYLGMNHDYQKIGIDFKTDMRESSHLNDKGAAKVTRYLGELLRDTYGLTGHHGEPGYETWDLHARFLEDKEDGYRLRDAYELNPYLETLAGMKERYTIVLTMEGNYRALGDDAYTSQLELLGIDRNAYETGGVFVIRNGEIVYYSGGAKELQFATVLSERIDLAIYGEQDKIHVFLDGREALPREEQLNGMTFLVYDEKCMYEVDKGYVNLYESLEIRRVTEEGDGIL